jgi:hypothetical protein
MHMIQNACNLRYKDAYTSCYICHAKCKKCTRESYTYATKELPHNNSRNETHTKLPRKRVKVAWSRGLVKISASWSSVGTRIKAIFPFSTLSLENGTSLLCAWFWNEELGSLLHLWHWCCNIEAEHGYTPHQSHSWCMWSKIAESNN